MISHMDCNAVAYPKESIQPLGSQNLPENFSENIVAVTSTSDTKRIPRSAPSEFDKLYDDFMFNYRHDDVQKHGNYRVRESAESESSESGSEESEDNKGHGRYQAQDSGENENENESYEASDHQEYDEAHDDEGDESE